MKVSGQYVPTARNFSNPLSSWRQEEVLAMYIKEWGFPEAGIHAKKLERLARKVAEQRKDYKKRSVITYRTLQPIIDYHSLLLEQIRKLKEEEKKSLIFIFETPFSRDMGPINPKIISTDAFSDQDLRSYQYREMWEKGELHNLDSTRVVHLRVDPIIIPYREVPRENGKYITEHLFPEDVVEEINDDCIFKGRRELGPPRSSEEPEFTYGFSKFSTSYFEPGMAALWYPEAPEDLLSLHCMYNRYRLISAYENLIQLLNPKRVVYYGKKTGDHSFAYEIIERAANRVGKPFVDLKCMRNVDTNLGESDERALKILKNYIRQAFREMEGNGYV